MTAVRLTCVWGCWLTDLCLRNDCCETDLCLRKVRSGAKFISPVISRTVAGAGYWSENRRRLCLTFSSAAFLLVAGTCITFTCRAEDREIRDTRYLESIPSWAGPAERRTERSETHGTQSFSLAEYGVFLSMSEKFRYLHGMDTTMRVNIGRSESCHLHVRLN